MHENRWRKSLWLAAMILPLLLITQKAAAHAGPLNMVAMAVCKNKQRSQACQYEGHHNDLYIGTCQYMSDEDLICVRNKPIQQIEPDPSDTSSTHDNTDQSTSSQHSQ